MEVMLDIKNVPKVMNPTVNSVIVFNGKNWYLTSKESLLKEAYELVQKADETIEKIKEENTQFRAEVASQLVEMSNAIKLMYEVEK